MTIEAVTIETAADGTVAMIEPQTRPGLDRRVFKQVGDAYEWCYLADWRAHGGRARWYGYAPRDLPASMLVA